MDATGDPVGRMMRDDAVLTTLGITVVEAAGGRATARMPVRAGMVNGHGIAHGGFVFALADTAFAYACNSHGPVTVAASAEIVFVAPAREGDELSARATERTRFGRNGIYDVTVRRGPGPDAEVIAEFRGASRTRKGAADATR